MSASRQTIAPDRAAAAPRPSRAKTWRRWLWRLAIGAVALYLGRATYSIWRWDALVWLPSYLRSHPLAETAPDDQRHVIFVMVDHYEPGKGPAGDAVNRRWLEEFRPVADRHRDSRGRKYRYTWAYPYDHHSELSLRELGQAAYDGYGEVEMHWHHPVSTSAEFPTQLREAVAWFQRHGALISSGPDARTQFGFVHGNFALDNSLPCCGVNRELDILFQQGCYADFTFSTVGTPAQPSKVNALYYATDDDNPKSYDDGQDVRVGDVVDDRLLMFQGPIGVDWLIMRFDYGAVERYAIPSRRRIERWIDTNIHVLGRPEWVFVKVYSHGCQSADEILHRHLDPMLTDLEEACRQRGMTLHYMTAREAYNVVKAAEAGRTGDPHDFRDFRLPPPRNMVVRP